MHYSLSGRSPCNYLNLMSFRQIQIFLKHLPWLIFLIFSVSELIAVCQNEQQGVLSFCSPIVTNLQSFKLTRGWNVIGLSLCVFFFSLFVIIASLFPFLFWRVVLSRYHFPVNWNQFAVFCLYMTFLWKLMLKFVFEFCVIQFSLLNFLVPTRQCSCLVSWCFVSLQHVYTCACVSVWDWWHSLSYRAPQLTLANFRVFKSYNHLIDGDSHLPLECWFDLLLP